MSELCIGLIAQEIDLDKKYIIKLNRQLRDEEVARLRDEVERLFDGHMGGFVFLPDYVDRISCGDEEVEC